MYSFIEIKQPNTSPAPREHKQEKLFNTTIVHFHLPDCSEHHIWGSLALFCLPDKVPGHRRVGYLHFHMKNTERPLINVRWFTPENDL